MATDDVYSTTACVTLSFIGYNDDPPMLTYTPAGIVNFVEEQSDAVNIVNGSFLLMDQDHPTRCVCTWYKSSYYEATPGVDMPLLPYTSYISRKQAKVGFMKFSRLLILRTGTWAHVPRLAESNYHVF